MSKSASTTTMLSGRSTPEAVYHSLIAEGKITEDAAQRKILAQLQSLYDALNEPKTLLNRIVKRPRAQGMYIWGNVGRGKSMLMDIFYATVPFAQKRRDHFHAFMLEVHTRLHAWRQENGEKETGKNPVVILAKEIAKKIRLLCLDEFQVTDITDAMILSRLFTSLIEEGVMVVATSNRPPESLYLGGLQREQFLPFIDLILQKLTVLELSSREDYRLKQLKSIDRPYFTPLGKAADAFVEKVAQSLSHGMAPQKRKLEVQGRILNVEVLAGNAARFTFHDLCEKPLGASDYIEIARLFSTVIITGIPQMSGETRNEAKRFVTLIDALYEHRVKLIATAAVAPEKLYKDTEGYFEFGRTVSRLHEMQSEQYFEASHIA